jgi:hypothetical protein
MADLKLSDLASSNNITDDTYFYAIQGGISKKLGSNVLVRNLVDATLKGSVVLEGVQLITGTDTNKTISLTKSRTEFSVGPYAVTPVLPNSPTDGLIKILTLANVAGGSVYLSTDNSNVYPNAWISLKTQGDSVMLMYSGNTYSNGWIILGMSPGVETSVTLAAANVSFERVRQAISAGDQTIVYNQANGTIIVGNIDNLLANINLANVTTDNIREGNTRLYYTNTRVANSPIVGELNRKNANIIYVSTNGNDAYDGRSMANAVANIHTAIGRITEHWSVHVLPGKYTLYNNPVTIPKRASLMGNDLRTVDVYPQNTTSDMFYMNTGAYVNGFTFRGHEAANPNNIKAGPAVFSYNPDGSAGNITTSPYIQNCSSITTTGTGVRVNGDYVTGLKSMVLDAFTQFNEGGIGIHLLNQGYMQLVSCFTICCHYAVLAESGGFASITNSNSSFGTYGLYADGVSPRIYGGVVLEQLTSRTVRYQGNTLPKLNDKILIANYNQDKCFRDTGLIVDSIALDLAYNSNTQSKFSGLQYWSQGVNNLSDQTVEVRNAMTYLQNLATNVVINSTAWDNSVLVPYQTSNTQVIISGAPGDAASANAIANLFATYNSIFTDGIYGVTDKIIPNRYGNTQAATWTNASNLLQQNKIFMQSEVAAYFANVYSYATYLPGKSIFTDVGQIIDSITFDLRSSNVGAVTNRQTVTKAILNYAYSSELSTIENQRPQTAGAFTFIKTFIDEILNKTTIANTYQTTYVQNTTFTGNVSASEIAVVRARIDDITDIITNGPQNIQNSIQPISLTANTNSNVVLATKIILANRDFIRAEVLAYVNLNWTDISNGTRNFYTVGDTTNLIANTCIITFDEKILAVDRPLANSSANFHRSSYLQTSTHTFEYVGSGDSLTTALPYNGGKPIQENEVVSVNGGAVYYTSTDHKGNFRIGDELLIDRATGTINGRTFNKSLFAVMTPYILALQ